jgi:hypothetical protein
MRRIALYLILMSVLFSCLAPPEKDSPTYFGGKIIKPKTDYVLLSKNEITIDTLYIDENGEFLKSVPVFEEGLYTFSHANEFQYLFMEPSDSIVISLNTWDFDESLVFSGKGGMKNEFLINLFIQNEKQEQSYFELFKLNPYQLKAAIEQIRKEKYNSLADFMDDNPELDNLYLKYVRAGIDYPLYQKMEIYPLVRKRYLNTNQFPELPADFYDYRSQISINDPVLQNFYSHRNYVLSYAYHLAYLELDKNPNENINIALMKVVSDSIEDPETKSNMMRSALYDEFFSSASINLNKELIETFLKLNESDKLDVQVRNLLIDAEQVNIASPLPDFEVLNLNNRPFEVSSFTKNRRCALFFWSESNTDVMSLANRVLYLQKKYPGILFLGINLDYEPTLSVHQKYLKGFPKSQQFSLTQTSEAKTFSSSKLPRTILINAQSMVIDNYGNISSPHIEKTLVKLLNY